MSNQYLLPLCFAAASHAALLFGFTKNPRPVLVESKERTVIPFVISPQEEPPVVTITERAETGPVSAPDTPPLPRGPEPLVLDLGERQTMTAPPFTPVDAGDVMRIMGPAFAGPGGDGSSPWTGGVIASSLLDNPPRTRLQSSPLYPPEARRDGLRGEVLVEFLVDESGRVAEARVVSSSHRVFEEATLRAVAKWQFEPGRRDGRIVRFRMAVPVMFNLND